jgi:hypothetical protein
MSKLTRLLAGVGAVAAVGALSVGVAAAGSAKFHSTSSSVSNSGALVVNWDQRGLGEGDINYTLTSDATALYACINRGGNHPEAANKEAFEGQVTAAGTFEAKNGRVLGTLTGGPLLAPSFTCPSGQARVLASVSYTNIVLTDTTNGVTANVADASRTFFDV